MLGGTAIRCMTAIMQPTLHTHFHIHKHMQTHGSINCIWVHENETEYHSISQFLSVYLNQYFRSWTTKPELWQTRLWSVMSLLQSKTTVVKLLSKRPVLVKQLISQVQVHKKFAMHNSLIIHDLHHICTTLKSAPPPHFQSASRVLMRRKSDSFAKLNYLLFHYYLQ